MEMNYNSIYNGTVLNKFIRNQDIRKKENLSSFRVVQLTLICTWGGWAKLPLTTMKETPVVPLGVELSQSIYSMSYYFDRSKESANYYTADICMVSLIFNFYDETLCITVTKQE